MNIFSFFLKMLFRVLWRVCGFEFLFPVFRFHFLTFFVCVLRDRIPPAQPFLIDIENGKLFIG